MHINDYQIAEALRRVRQMEAEQHTHRTVVNVLISWKNYGAADQYLRPFAADTDLDVPLDAAS